MRVSLLELTIFATTFIFACGTDLGTNPNDPALVSQAIVASEGGSIRIGDELTLVIPANSLAQDTTISVERVPGYSGKADGLASFGQAYRFLPAGTLFDPANPA